MREIMRWYSILILLLAASAPLISDVDSAERSKPIRIGALTDSWGPTPGVVGLRDGLQELGYRENTDFVIGVRFTQGDISALPTAARDLVQQGVDLLFTSNPAPAKAAHMATNRIPIIFYGAGDPMGLGLIQSFARPGGNITGVTDLDLELDTKRLEIFKEMIPGLKRVLFSYDPSDAFSVAQSKVYRDTARLLNIALIDCTAILLPHRSTRDCSGKMAWRDYGTFPERTNPESRARAYPETIEADADDPYGANQHRSVWNSTDCSQRLGGTTTSRDEAAQATQPIWLLF